MNQDDECPLSKDPDWSKFPTELFYISESIDRYRPLMDRPRFTPDRLTKGQVRELDALARLIGSRNHFIECDSLIADHLHDRDVECEHLSRFLSLIDSLGIDNNDYGPREPDSVLDCWERLNYRLWWQLIPETVAILGEASFDFVRKFFDRIPKKHHMHLASQLLLPLRSAKTLDWIEVNISYEPQEMYEFENWGRIAAMSQLTWPRAVRWLERGGLLRIAAIDALSNMGGKSAASDVRAASPRLIDAPPFVEAEALLLRTLSESTDPKLSKKIRGVLKHWKALTPD